MKVITGGTLEIFLRHSCWEPLLPLSIRKLPGRIEQVLLFDLSRLAKFKWQPKHVTIESERQFDWRDHDSGADWRRHIVTQRNATSGQEVVEHHELGKQQSLATFVLVHSVLVVVYFVNRYRLLTVLIKSVFTPPKSDLIWLDQINI